MLSNATIRAEIEFEPLASIINHGRNLQESVCLYHNTAVRELSIFPNIFSTEKVTTFYWVEVLIPKGTFIPNGILDMCLYTDDNHGNPRFDKLEDALDYIDTIKSLQS